MLENNIIIGKMRLKTKVFDLFLFFFILNLLNK